MNFFSDLGKFILRISFSLMMLTHGISKVDRLFADEIKFSDPIGIGSFLSLILIAFAEFVAPIFILIGFKSRWFSIFPVIGMAVAAFVSHWEDPFPRKEKALLFMFGFLVIAMIGPGKYSIDKK
ncbi:MAG: DoxX family protein [Flavobacteriaceae bacterium]|nr:DoxX family protein [Flavobacteriaceae bacterium]|tara:strand:- start:1038 stop:1409 length:372 start_codon:yes stop_codon:yes gene_type:complete